MFIQVKILKQALLHKSQVKGFFSLWTDTTSSLKSGSFRNSNSHSSSGSFLISRQIPMDLLELFFVKLMMATVSHHFTCANNMEERGEKFYKTSFQRWLELLHIKSGSNALHSNIFWQLNSILTALAVEQK